jgi:hypothetical protein
MPSERAEILRWTFGSAAGWGTLFAGVSVARALQAGVAFSDFAGPVAALGVIGATVGGLVGPLLRGIAARRRGR